jgi:inward rectifier potassium channel
VVAAVLVVGAISNAIFAGLYMLGDTTLLQEGTSIILEGSTGIEGIEGPLGFKQAFYFSVQTMSTIGYGGMAPISDYAHMLVTMEAACGILGATLITGLMFAKAARPQSSVLFSNVALVTNHDDERVMMFRVGNARGNDVVEATIRVSALVQKTTAEGRVMRSLVDLKLRRHTTPIFSITWSIFHEIDEESPFYGLTQESFDENIQAIIVIMTGHDATYAQTTHARHLYQPEDLRFDRQFVDVIHTLDDGNMLIDYDEFHHTKPLKTAAEPET